jgi:acetyl-CoA carboxylase carboxyltransferase component
MCGPAFEPEACLALPTASIAVMGAQAAVNAVHYNSIHAVPEGPARDALVQKLRDEYREDVSLEKLASELVVDAVVPFENLRSEIVSRLATTPPRRSVRIQKKHIVPPM